MSKLNTINFDNKTHEFLVNGQSLLSHLKKHEFVNPNDHMSSVVAQPGSCDRLLNVDKPDLHGGFVALYLCGLCGGYDGVSIGTKVMIDSEKVYWNEIGFYSDIEDHIHQPFKKVRSFVFSAEQYNSVIESAKIYEPAKFA